jgi:hypothetical protein
MRDATKDFIKALGGPAPLGAAAEAFAKALGSAPVQAPREAGPVVESYPNGMAKAEAASTFEQALGGWVGENTLHKMPRSRDKFEDVQHLEPHFHEAWHASGGHAAQGPKDFKETWTKATKGGIGADDLKGSNEPSHPHHDVYVWKYKTKRVKTTEEKFGVKGKSSVTQHNIPEDKLTDKVRATKTGTSPIFSSPDYSMGPGPHPGFHPVPEHVEQARAAHVASKGHSHLLSHADVSSIDTSVERYHEAGKLTPKQHTRVSNALEHLNGHLEHATGQATGAFANTVAKNQTANALHLHPTAVAAMSRAVRAYPPTPPTSTRGDVVRRHAQEVEAHKTLSDKLRHVEDSMDLHPHKDESQG